MVKLENRKQINIFTALCCAVYFTSYLTRKNYDAALVEIYTSMAISKSLASLASTGSVITYGAGQLLSGVLGDKFKPKYIITGGLAVTAVCNLLLPLCTTIYPMIVVWCINGLAQAMMWPPLVRIMSEMLDESNYKKGVLRVTIASACSTILIYILIPVCIKISEWRTAFFISSACAVIIIFIWFFGLRSVEKITGVVGAGKKMTVNGGEVKTLKSGYVFAAGLIPISLSIILQGTLRDGVTTWMPSIVSEVYDLGTSISIFSTVALPILGIVSSTAASALQRKLKSEIKSALILYIISAVSAVLLLIFHSYSLISSILFMAIITACMHGINLMLVCEVPNYFAAYGKVSTISGVLNSFTYVGSALSIYGIAAIAEKSSGWSLNFAIWIVISVLGGLCCLLSMKKWHSFKAEQ